MPRPKIKQYEVGQTYRYAHLKRDGMWLEVTVTYDLGLVRCWSRQNTELTQALEGLSALTEIYNYADKGNVLYGELYAPGYPASEVKHFIAEKQLDRLRFDMFAAGHLPENMPLEAVARWHAERFNPHLVGFAPFTDLRVSSHWDWREFLPDAEGVVFKDGNLLNWCKWKPRNTVDLIVMGYTEGQGKYSGMIGAIVLGYMERPGMITEVTRVSGMCDITRLDITEHKQEYLNRVVEVEYQYVASRGGLRHPQFKCFRDDKRADECTARA